VLGEVWADEAWQAPLRDLVVMPVDDAGRWETDRAGLLRAADPDKGRELCQRFVDRFTERGVPTRTGSFGALMTVSVDNDGPVTIALSTDEWETRIST